MNFTNLELKVKELEEKGWTAGGGNLKVCDKCKNTPFESNY